MLKLSTALALAISLLSCNASKVMPAPTTQTPQLSQVTPMKMPTLEIASIKNVTLIARQEALAPPGVESSPDRPIGFASIFLTLENPSDRIQTLDLLQVEVIAVDNDEIQLSSNAAQTIKLMPLENAVLDIQLSNREGYGTKGEVKAIATYRLNDTVHRIESPIVEIR